MRKQVVQPGPRKAAVVSVINEFKVDQDLQFVYCLIFTVDSVGVQNCVGMVFMCDEANRAAIIKVRGELADDVLSQMTKRHDAQVARGEGEYVDSIQVIEPGSEAEVQMLDEILKSKRER